jgi:hypothetical protein
MWSEYLKDVKEYDEALTETWKEDANGVLTFVSLHLLVQTLVTTTNRKTAIFSAVVGAFIIESYKMLSPDSGNQTVFLLRQLSNQVNGLANGTIIQPQPDPGFSPGISIIWVNIIWLLSLVLSTTSALLATLTQQWARRYLQLPQIPSVPSERARVRSFLFRGTVMYAIHYAVEIAPTLLHLSVFLFNIGLVLFFFTIFKTVAIIVLAFVVLFGVLYSILTILPCLHHICPYHTPMSDIFWYLWHAFASLVEVFLEVILKRLHAILVPYNLGEPEVQSRRQRKLIKWLTCVENDLTRHKQRLRDGFRGSIVKDALLAPQDIDVKALTWLFQLPALAEKSKIENFVACLPGDTIVQLLSNPLGRGKVTFREHLSSLMRSCEPGAGGLDEDMRKHRLSVCLNAIHHIVRASIGPGAVSQSQDLLNDLRISFANISLMRPLLVDGNHAIRVTARSICALLARHLLRKFPLEQSELAWLQDVTGKSSNTIYNQLQLDEPTTVDNMNVDSFVYGVFSDQMEDLPIIQATSFTETLAILMNSGSLNAFRRETFENQLSFLIRRVEEGDHAARDNVLDKLRRMFQVFLPTAGQQPQASNP